MVAVALPSSKFMDVLVHLARRPTLILQEISRLRNIQGAVGIGRLIDEFVSRTSGILNEADKNQKRWNEEGRVLRHSLWQRAVEGLDGVDSLEDYSKLIEYVDNENSDLGQEIERLQKYFCKGQKEARSYSKDAGVALSRVDDRLVSYLQRELEERIDFALFLRALRAQINPKSRGGESFEDAKALKAYLERALG